jgi:hypothetical protein
MTAASAGSRQEDVVPQMSTPPRSYCVRPCSGHRPHARRPARRPRDRPRWCRVRCAWPRRGTQLSTCTSDTAPSGKFANGGRALPGVPTRLPAAAPTPGCRARSTRPLARPPSRAFTGCGPDPYRGAFGAIGPGAAIGSVIALRLQDRAAAHHLGRHARRLARGRPDRCLRVGLELDHPGGLGPATQRLRLGVLVCGIPLPPPRSAGRHGGRDRHRLRRSPSTRSRRRLESGRARRLRDSARLPQRSQRPGGRGLSGAHRPGCTAVLGRPSLPSAWTPQDRSGRSGGVGFRR